MEHITKILAREVLDSRGNPTVEVELHSAKHKASAIVPSGASTGTHEAVELRDGGKRFHGHGVLNAVKHVTGPIAKAIKGMEPKQQEIDQTLIDLDGTEQKEKFGANAILGVSLATARLRASIKNIPLYKALGPGKVLPVPFMNIVNGGVHAANDLAIQEFMIVPKAKNFSESLRMAAEIYHELKVQLKKKYGMGATNVGDEGGFAPPMKKTKEALDMITKTVDELGHTQKIHFAMDAAASEFFKKDHYLLDGKKVSVAKMVDFYADLVKTYPIISIEDPFAEDAFEDFHTLKKALGRKVQIVGDDLLVTQISRVQKALQHDSCSALLLKVNQVGTVTEAQKAAILSREYGWRVMVSHRSGETEDSFIADLAVGLGTGQLKGGAPARGERTAKYNRLLRIEEELGKKAKYGLGL